MKRYGNLYPQICSMENIQRAHMNARKGKAHYHEVQMVNANEELYISKIQDMLLNKTFKNSEYTTFMKLDSKKEREIFKLPYFPDRIIHHCIVQVLESVWMKTLIADTYSSLKGRGIHKGVKRIKAALTDKENTTYCLKLDVRKFYPSIDHDILKTILQHKIKDTDVMWILNEIINSTSGVPIGNYLSQHFGNLYLSGFDHYMKEQQHCKYYFRYCDDVIILHASKEHLADLRVKASEHLEKNLKLQLKSNWQVFPVAIRGIDFLGYRFYHTHTTLRKSIATKLKQTIAKTKSSTPKTIGMVNSITSYQGWMKYANCYNLQTNLIDNQIHKIAEDICKANGTNNPLRGAVNG
jgi:hypothetical protein